MTDNRIVVTKRVSLAGVSEGWDESCYALVKPATYDDNIVIEETDVSKLSRSEQVAVQEKFVQDHFIKGEVMLFDGEDFALGALTKNDVAASVDLLDALYMGILGIDSDPKDIRKAVEATTLHQIDTKPTQTQSSTKSESVETTSES